METEGSFSGVGIVISVKDKQLTVVSPIEGTPGDKAGIRSGDQVEIMEGLQAGDEYVVMGQNKLTDGANVERVKTAPGAAGEPPAS